MKLFVPLKFDDPHTMFELNNRIRSMSEVMESQLREFVNNATAAGATFGPLLLMAKSMMPGFPDVRVMVNIMDDFLTGKMFSAGLQLPKLILPKIEPPKPTGGLFALPPPPPKKATFALVQPSMKNALNFNDWLTNVNMQVLESAADAIEANLNSLSQYSEDLLAKYIESDESNALKTIGAQLNDGLKVVSVKARRIFDQGMKAHKNAASTASSMGHDFADSLITGKDINAECYALVGKMRSQVQQSFDMMDEYSKNLLNIAHLAQDEMDAPLQEAVSRTKENMLKLSKMSRTDKDNVQKISRLLDGMSKFMIAMKKVQAKAESDLQAKGAQHVTVVGQALTAEAKQLDGNSDMQERFIALQKSFQDSAAGTQVIDMSYLQSATDELLKFTDVMKGVTGMQQQLTQVARFLENVRDALNSLDGASRKVADAAQDFTTQLKEDSVFPGISDVNKIVAKQKKLAHDMSQGLMKSFDHYVQDYEKRNGEMGAAEEGAIKLMRNAMTSINSLMSAYANNVHGMSKNFGMEHPDQL